MFIPDEEFKQIVKNTPLVNIDFVIENLDGNFLLGYRTNKPAKGSWFVPGGRIRKEETIEAAFRRISKDELNLKLDITKSEFLGVYEHFYCDNTFDESGFGTHYIVLAYKIGVDISIINFPKTQHNYFKWFSKEEVLSCFFVHENAKAYFNDLLT